MCKHKRVFSGCARLPNGTKVVFSQCRRCGCVRSKELYPEDPSYATTVVTVDVNEEEGSSSKETLVYATTLPPGIPSFPADEKPKWVRQWASFCRHTSLALRAAHKIVIEVCVLIGLLAFAGHYIWEHVHPVPVHASTTGTGSPSP